MGFTERRRRSLGRLVGGAPGLRSRVCVFLHRGGSDARTYGGADGAEQPWEKILQGRLGGDGCQMGCRTGIALVAVGKQNYTSEE